MRLIVPFVLAMLLATPVRAADCGPLADRFLILQETTANLMGLVQARPVDWKDLEIPAGGEAAYANLKTATDAMLPMLQRYIQTGRNAVPVVDDCRASRTNLPAGQFVLLQRAVLVADGLVPLLVRYLVAYDAAMGVAPAEAKP